MYEEKGWKDGYLPAADENLWRKTERSEEKNHQWLGNIKNP